MNDFILTPDDPKLTAYALGELEGEERAAVEEALRLNPALGAAVEEIRATAAQLESALATEPEAESIVAAAAASPMSRPVVDEYRRPRRGPLGKLLEFPGVYFVIGGAAAAVVAVMVALHPPPPAPSMAKSSPGRPVYVHVPIVFAPADPASEEKSMTVALPRAETGQEATLAKGTAPGAVASETSVSLRGADGALVSGAGVPGVPTADAVPPTMNPRELAMQSPAIGSTIAESGGSTRRAASTGVPAPVTDGTSPNPRQATTDFTPAENLGVVVSTAPAPVTAPAPEPVVPGGAAGKNGAASTTVSRGAGSTAADNEVVTLSAFSVTGDRESNAMSLGASRARRDALPTAPYGARFGGKNAGSGYASDNDFLGAEENPTSKIPIAAATGSYDEVRRAILGGKVPARESVRIEELVNYFPYRYAPPAEKDDKPFAAAFEVAETPWAPTHRLVRIALKGREPAAADRLSPIAKDVQVEIEFNPEKVSSYRLIGYENPRLKKGDFNSDRVDTMDIAAGHAVTALYEIVPVGAEERRRADRPAADDLRYQRGVVVSSRLETASKTVTMSNELLMVTVKYKKPDGFFNFSRTAEFPLVDSGRSFAEASPDFKFTAAVAEFGMILRGSPHKGSGTMGDVVSWAAAGARSNADDPRGYRGDFIGLARKAQTLLR